MRQLTAEQFRKSIELDPAWAAKLIEPIEITDYCDMENSKITHLSPLLHFTGRDSWKNAASFRKCESLKVAEGTFHGNASFSGSGIQKIGKLRIAQPDKDGNAAYFRGCRFLKVAEGTFPGRVNFAFSGIEKIGNLRITKPYHGRAASFHFCKHLKVADGTFPGFVNFTESGIEIIGNLRITNPNSAGEYLWVKGSPIAEAPNELRKIFQQMPPVELKTALQKSQDDGVKLALNSLIGKIVLQDCRNNTSDFEL